MEDVPTLFSRGGARRSLTVNERTLPIPGRDGLRVLEQQRNSMRKDVIGLEDLSVFRSGQTYIPFVPFRKFRPNAIRDLPM